MSQLNKFPWELVGWWNSIMPNACQWPIIWIKTEEDVLHVLFYSGLIMSVWVRCMRKLLFTNCLHAFLVQRTCQTNLNSPKRNWISIFLDDKPRPGFNSRLLSDLFNANEKFQLRKTYHFPSVRNSLDNNWLVSAVLKLCTRIRGYVSEYQTNSCYVSSSWSTDLERKL